MGYLCARCKKDIANDVRRFLGTTYCPECCAAAIATPPYSPQSIWCINVKEVVEEGKYTYSLNEKGDEYFIDTYRKVSGFFRSKTEPQAKLHFHKLFTHEYSNNQYRSEMVLNADDGVPFELTFGVDGGYEGRGNWISFRQYTYPELGGTIIGKNQKVQELFQGLNAENWRDYLDKTYPDRLVASYVCFVAVTDGDVTRIAVSFQSNPVHYINYAECPADVYRDWKKSRGSLEHCLYDFRMLPGIATDFFTKKHSVFQAKNYMFVVNEEPEEGGNVDIAISGNCSTNLWIYESVSHENASRFVNMIGLACK